jgi:hypothetical protein
MVAKLWDLVDGKVKISSHCHTIEDFKTIIDTFGEATATKIFTVYQYMADLNPDTNPFANISEVGKLEFIVSKTCPKLPVEIDWNDDIFQEGIETTRTCYSTGSYRGYLAQKTLRDKVIYAVQNAPVSASKDDGNTSELDRLLKVLDSVTESTRKAFSEFEAEQGLVQRKGGRRAVTRTIGGKATELN